MNFIYSSFFILFLVGCSAYDDTDRTPSVVGDITDKASWYDDSNNNVLDMKITIPEVNELKCAPYTNPTDPLRACTFDDINHDILSYDTYEPELSAELSSENSNTTYKGVLKLRGDYSRTLEQKSYSFKLDSKDDLLLSQRKFQFIKSQSDRSRAKNKLVYDLIHSIPNITTLKTQFVHLYIKDEQSSSVYVDYGLFTHVEALREEFLVNRDWNDDDNLYNAVNLFFEPSEGLAVDKDGVPLDEVAFNTIVEIKNGTNHKEIGNMIDAINSTENIDDVIEKYFNRDNYLTWLALNLVLGNKDITYHNFYLYNPKYSEKFYFLPWDYDGAWSTKRYLSKYEYGISVWWESPLHRKFLTIKKNRDDLYKKADEIRELYISDKIVQGKIDIYKENIEYFMSQDPDNKNNSDSSFLESMDYLVTGIQYNIDLYKSVIGHPMPFWQYTAFDETNLTISWDTSIDLEGDSIVYDVRVSRDADFTDVIFDQQNIVETQVVINRADYNITDNIYYLQVLSREKDDSSHYQVSFNQFYESEIRYGISEFQVGE